MGTLIVLDVKDASAILVDTMSYLTYHNYNYNDIATLILTCVNYNFDNTKIVKAVFEYVGALSLEQQDYKLLRNGILEYISQLTDQISRSKVNITANSKLLLNFGDCFTDTLILEVEDRI